MKPALALAALLAWQATARDTQPADPAHLRYQRALQLPANAAGQACVLLDGTVFAHSAQTSARDLRLFASAASIPEHEVDAARSESATQPLETVTFPARDAAIHSTADGSELAFDLDMPARPYSAVELQLQARDFVGIARVTLPGQPERDLGSFVIFDLTGRGLPRSTTLALAEATYPVLHVSLRLLQPSGKPWPHLVPSLVAGAIVPPSREAQVLYTPIAETPATTAATTQGTGTDTVFRFPTVPAHVPVERLRFTLLPHSNARFLREVTLQAQPIGPGNAASNTAESVRGTVAAVAAPAAGEAPAIHYEHLTLPATLGVTLSSPAQVVATLRNGTAPPPPLATAILEMRQRTLCFEAQPGLTYTLRYGDATLPAPLSRYAHTFTPAAQPVRAVLGPEQENPLYRPRQDSRSYTERHPETVFVALLIAIAASVLLALESVKRRRHR